MPNTESAGALPNASVDFNKVHSAAKQGKKDIWDGHCEKERGTAAADEQPSKEVREISKSVAEARADLAEQQGDKATAEAIHAELEEQDAGTDADNK